MTGDSRQNGERISGNFLNELRATFAERAGQPAILSKAGRWTYRDLDLRARRCARRLSRLGVEPGDRVAIVTPEKLPFLVAHLGAVYAATVSVPLNPRFTRGELKYFLEDSGARVVVAGEHVHPVIESLRAELPDLHALLTDAEAYDAPEGAFPEPAVGPDDPCLILYTSGTTGRPKGIVQTHANLASSLNALRSLWRFTPDDAVVNVLPLFHIHGLSCAMHLSLLTGCRMYVENSFHPRRTQEVVGRGTVFMANPTIYYSFLEQPEFRRSAREWAGVRLFTCGSAPIRPDVLPGLESALGRAVINRYGMSEAHVITSLPLDGPWPHGSVGLPLAGVEVRVIKDDGSRAVPGEVGSVQIRGPNVFREYWRRPDATREAFSSGWFDTGDLGSRDVHGFLTLTARKSDLIITNGYNVYPQAVERVINDCPGVRESAVVGLPDKRRGERVVAAVVRADETLLERTLRAYLSERLVDYQRPADIFFVPALPRNAMGKLLRRALGDQLADH